MKRLSAIAVALAAVVLTAFGCATMSSDEGWITLLDGSNPATFNNWNRIGDANWRVEGGAVVADMGKGGHLVSKNSYGNFQIRAEFWADHTTNSGIFIRASDPSKIGSASAYEVNIYDQRPDPAYGTGAIVNYYKVVPMPKAGGKWNTFVIAARDTHLTVEMNGIQTVTLYDSKYASGPISLQFANGPKGAPGGAIKWRKVEIKPL